jgi:hypothetical protein
MTFMMRPSVPSPTGTEIGAPGVGDRLAAHQAFGRVHGDAADGVSPRCWATSSTRRLPLLVVSSAFRIAGSAPSNCTSTTAPMTWVTLPALAGMEAFGAFAIVCLTPGSSERLGARNDFDEFLGDLRLTLTVVLIVSLLIMSPALRVALSIADIRAPCSEAPFSSRPRKICVATLRGSRSARISPLPGS